mmetsp:Transcript_59985/g.106746  ORF Transcript_59985/g.106746 Transcript_59985/m.106746 type:complete len:222 (+) Transcript_59985:479-1144(+)
MVPSIQSGASLKTSSEIGGGSMVSDILLFFPSVPSDTLSTLTFTFSKMSGCPFIDLLVTSPVACPSPSGEGTETMIPASISLTTTPSSHVSSLTSLKAMQSTCTPRLLKSTIFLFDMLRTSLFSRSLSDTVASTTQTLTSWPSLTTSEGLVTWPSAHFPTGTNPSFSRPTSTMATLSKTLVTTPCSSWPGLREERELIMLWPKSISMSSAPPLAKRATCCS